MPEFYSQYGEDRLLAEMFSQKKGTCVEIGALDGVRHSNTYHFEQRGWTCILVEPNPISCQAIRLRRKARLFECAVSDTTGELDFVVSDELPELSGFQPFVERIHREHGTTRSVKVKVRTLNDVLGEASMDSIDFMTIDVEGHELSVLRGLSLDRWKPRVVIVEDGSEGTDCSVELAMRAAHYMPWRMTGNNMWYSHEGDIQFLNSANMRSFRRARAMRRIRHTFRPWLIEPLKSLRRRL